MTLLPNPAITGIEEEGAFAILDRALKLKGEGKPIINLGIGQPDFNPPPHVLEAAREGGARRAAWLYVTCRHRRIARSGGGPRRQALPR